MANIKDVHCLMIVAEGSTATELARRLRRLSYGICGHADSAQQAYELAEVHQPDLALVDIRPSDGEDGVNIGRIIWECFGIPVVFLTGQDDADLLERATIAHPFGHLTKPINDQNLKNTTETALYVARVDRERNAAERALREESIWRRILINGSRDGIVVIDRFGKVYDANQKYADMLGYTMEEVFDLRVWDWDAQWTKEELLEMTSTVDESGDHFETRHLRKDGTTLDVEISTNAAICGGRKLIFCVCRDITNRKQAENALKRSEERFRQMSDLLPGAVIETDVDYNITYANRHGLELFGYTREDIDRGLNGIKSIHPEDRARALEDMLPRLKKKTLISEELRMFTKSGDAIWVSFNASAILHDKEMTGVRVVLIDIGQRKKVEAQREKLISKLQEALSEIKVLRGFLPICSCCKKIRDDEGYWQQMEQYIQERTEAQFSHSLCPDCARKLYPNLFQK